VVARLLPGAWIPRAIDEAAPPTEPGPASECAWYWGRGVESIDAGVVLELALGDRRIRGRVLCGQLLGTLHLDPGSLGAPPRLTEVGRISEGELRITGPRNTSYSFEPGFEREGWLEVRLASPAGSVEDVFEVLWETQDALGGVLSFRYDLSTPGGL